MYAIEVNKEIYDMIRFYQSGSCVGEVKSSIEKYVVDNLLSVKPFYHDGADEFSIEKFIAYVSNLPAIKNSHFGGKIAMIKEVRSKFGIGLKEAKDAVEAYLNKVKQ